MKVSSSMTTEEAIKKFTETCDTKDASLDEMINAYQKLGAAIVHPAQCDYALKNASQAEKLDALIKFYDAEHGRLFVKFMNIPLDETLRRAVTLQEIKDHFKTVKMLLFIRESDSNEIQEARSQSGEENV